MEKRKNVSCSSCGKEWEINEEDYRELKVCPFCVSEYHFPEETIIVDSFQKAIKKVISSFGIGVLDERSKFLSCLLDYGPEYKKEVKIVSRVCTESVFAEIATWPSIDVAAQTASISKLKTVLIEEEALSAEWADKIINSFSSAIIPEKHAPLTPVPTSKKPEAAPLIQDSSASSPQEQTASSISYEKTDEGKVHLLFTSSVDPKSVMAKKLLYDADISFNYIEVEKYPAVAGRFSIHQTPVLLVNYNGREEQRLQGIESIKEYIRGKSSVDDQVVSSIKSVSQQYVGTIFNANLKKALGVENGQEVFYTKRANVSADCTFKGRNDIDIVIVDGYAVSEGMFENCSKLKAVYFSYCPQIGKNAFANCKSLRYVVFDGSVAPRLDLWTFDCCPTETKFIFKWDNRLTCKGVCERLARKQEQVVMYNPADRDLSCIVEYARKRVSESKGKR